MNVCLYAFYRIVNYAYDLQRFLIWHDQLCAAALPAVVIVLRVTPRGSVSILYKIHN